MATQFEVTTDARSEYRPVLRRTDDGCSVAAGTVYHLYHVTIDIPAHAAADGAATTLSLYVLAPDEDHATCQAMSWNRDSHPLVPDLRFRSPQMLEQDGVKHAAARVPFRVRGWGGDEF